MSDHARRIAAVILAAGGSSRLGAAKQLVEFRGEPLVRRAVRTALDAGASTAIVVLGARAVEVRDALAGLANVHTVMNERWVEGLASSLSLGVREAARREPRCDGVLIATADQPLVRDVALRSLIDQLGEARLVAAEYAGTIGVPAVIGREYFAALEALTGDAGAGRWLRAKGAAVTCVPIPDAAVDIDEVEDLHRLEALV